MSSNSPTKSPQEFTFFPTKSPVHPPSFTDVCFDSSVACFSFPTSQEGSLVSCDDLTVDNCEGNYIVAAACPVLCNTCQNTDCDDLQPTGLIYNTGCAAACNNLVDFCDLPVIAERCPTTCKTDVSDCHLIRRATSLFVLPASISQKSLEFRISEVSGSGGDGKDNSAIAAAILAPVVIMALVLVLVVITKFSSRPANATSAEKASDGTDGIEIENKKEVKVATPSTTSKKESKVKSTVESAAAQSTEEGEEKRARKNSKRDRPSVDGTANPAFQDGASNPVTKEV